MDEKEMLEHAVAPSLTVAQASAADIPCIMSIERRPGYPDLVGSYDATSIAGEGSSCTG